MPPILASVSHIFAAVLLFSPQGAALHPEAERPDGG